jgi:hypothetical protein
MGKAARAACIFTPWALTIASFVCLVLITISGGASKGTLSEFHFFKANFTELDVMASNLPSDDLTAALKQSAESNQLARVYEIHLWNFCERNTNEAVVTWCSPKMKDYFFDPVVTWGLDSAQQNMMGDEEDKILGKAAQETLDAYRGAALWLFIAYEIALWASLATILCGVLAIFSRIGSFLTWLFSIVRPFFLFSIARYKQLTVVIQILSLFTFAAVLTSTVIFSALVSSMNEIFKPYNVHLSIGTKALWVVWLAVLFAWAGTLFWLLSACCCSGRNNPHHRSNKGGLWSSSAKPSDYARRHRGLRVLKAGSGTYEKISTPILAEDEEPLTTETEYGRFARPAHSRETSGKFEPLRDHPGV